MLGFNSPKCPVCPWRFQCPVRKYITYVAQNHGDVINQNIDTVFKKVLDAEPRCALLRCPYVSIYKKTTFGGINIDLDLYGQLPRLQELHALLPH